MILPLTRPLVSLDVETHAMCKPEEARIVELGFVMLYPDDREPKRWQDFIKPDLLITDEAVKKHGITNDMVAGSMMFPELAANLARGFSGCDFCGYNVRFDLRVLSAEMERAKVAWTPAGAHMLDSLRLWSVVKPRGLGDAVEEFLGRKPTEAHRAMGDAEDALAVTLAQLERWDHLPRDVKQLHDLCFEQLVDLGGKFIRIDGEVLCNFGVHARVKLSAMPIGYLNWMLKGTFATDVQELIRAEVARRAGG